MSLINQMLKDLDDRREETARGRLHREVRPLPAAQPKNNDRRVLLVVLVALAAVGGGWWYQQQLPSSAVQAVPAAPTIAPTAALNAPVAVSPQPTPINAAVEPVLPQTEAPVLASIAVDDASGMKLSAALEKVPDLATKPVPTKQPQAVPMPAVAETAPAKPKAEAKIAAVSPPVVKPEPPVKTNGISARGTVEKHAPTAKTGRQRAEQDYQAAVTLVNGARVQEAIELLLHALQEDGGHIASRQLLARLLIEQRSYDEAAALLAEGLAAQPGQTAWAMSLARLQVEKANLGAAAQTLQRSVSYATGNPDYFGFYGLVQYRLGHAKESAVLYRTAAQLSPADGRWWLGLGLALEAGQLPDAREAFLRARATGSLSPDLRTLVDQKLR